MQPIVWAILTGEYPPEVGGVGDYTRIVAQALASAGDEVHVWTPSRAAKATVQNRVWVHPLPDRYSPRSLVRLTRELADLRQPYRLLLQYTPNAFGMLGTNYPFAIWLATQRVRPWVMFHELYMPLTRAHPMKYNALALAQRAMLALVMHTTERAFVSIPNWGERLAMYSNGQPVEWLPIPSGVVEPVEPAQSAAIRARYLTNPKHKLIGTFGTYGKLIADMLLEIIPPLLAGHEDRVMLLMGRGSETFAGQLLAAHPQLAGQVQFTGSLPSGELSAHLVACDLLIQPYPDGVSTRRSSLIAGMGLGVPTVAPVGALSESFWMEQRPIIVVPEPSSSAMLAAAERALADPAVLVDAGRNAKQFYEQRLDVKHTVAALRS